MGVNGPGSIHRRGAPLLMPTEDLLQRLPDVSPAAARLQDRAGRWCESVPPTRSCVGGKIKIVGVGISKAIDTEHPGGAPSGGKWGMT